jgi:hypothetical protein
MRKSDLAVALVSHKPRAFRHRSYYRGIVVGVVVHTVG